MKSLGRTVTYVSDEYTTPVLRRYASDSEVIDFPIDGVVNSKGHAKAILERVKPSLLISIERCGRTRDDTYLNMRYVDISPHTARLDYLFDSDIPSVGIGDGGNETGMGNLAEVIPTVESLPDYPAVNQVDRLVIASVSNWGGYGLVAALSVKSDKNLLPSVEQGDKWVRDIVAVGAVEGMSGESKDWVDGRPPEDDAMCLRDLHTLLTKEGL